MAIHYVGRSLFDKLDVDTCLAPEADNWTDLNCSLQLSVWGGSGPEIEGSGRNLMNQLVPYLKIRPCPFRNGLRRELYIIQLLRLALGSARNFLSSQIAQPQRDENIAARFPAALWPEACSVVCLYHPCIHIYI